MKNLNIINFIMLVIVLPCICIPIMDLNYKYIHGFGEDFGIFKDLLSRYSLKQIMGYSLKFPIVYLLIPYQILITFFSKHTFKFDKYWIYLSFSMVFFVMLYIYSLGYKHHTIRYKPVLGTYLISIYISVGIIKTTLFQFKLFPNKQR